MAEMTGLREDVFNVLNEHFDLAQEPFLEMWPSFQAWLAEHGMRSVPLGQKIPYDASPTETKRRAVALYDLSVAAAKRYPQDGETEKSLHEHAILGVYEVGFLDGIYQKQEEQG